MRLLALFVMVGASMAVQNPEDFVNIRSGTKSRIDFSTGNVLPFVGRPWGMNQWSPHTNNYKVSDHPLFRSSIIFNH